MNFIGHQNIFKLQSRFLDLLDTDLIYEDYLINVQKMLYAVKEVFSPNIIEAALYSFQDWNRSYENVISTNKETTLHTIPTIFHGNRIINKINKFSIGSEKVVKNGKMIRLNDRNQKSYFLVLNANFASSDLLTEEDILLKDIAEEFESFLTKLQKMYEVLKEERKYKQLFRATQKLHSSMKMENVLSEVIYTLQDIYPSFTYYLLLSHDNNSHGDLPVKDLEYDSENMAAMKAYVTGDIQFEEMVDENKAITYAPLKGKQGIYGVLQIIAPHTNIFPKNEVEFITAIANVAGGALENAQLYQQSKKLVADLQLINEASHQLNSNLRLTEIMTYMCERISTSFHAKEVGFILFSCESNSIKVLQGSSPFFFEKKALKYIQFFKEIIQVEKDSMFLGDFSIQMDDTEYKSIMAVPMIQTGILKGFAIVMHPDPYYFSFDTFKLLQSLIHHSTLALTNSMLREELEKMVVTDHLTKLYSRSFLDEKIECSLTEDKEGTFILVDIDNFKSINDTYGHQVGDEIIVQVANIIIENIRSSDIGSRWGGEELAIYLPRVPLSIGVSVAERLVSKVRKWTSPTVTISCGVSYWNKETKENYHTIFKRADKALYIAKETGKNKVVVQDSLLC